MLAALPILASTARGLAEEWMPAGDQAIIAVRAYDVFSAHPPLVGQYSLVSAVTGHLTYSPGPLLYWLIALPARFGSPHSIALAIGLANALAAIFSVALARRRGGVDLMLACAAAIALMCRSFMPEALHDNWNPSAGLLPLTLLVFLSWSLACGERRLLPAVALVASFTAQCQVAFLAPTVALVAVGVAGLAISRRHRGRPSRGVSARDGSERESRPNTGRLWPWALAALAVLALCWAPPTVDELEHDPGNLTLLYRAATHHAGTVGLADGGRALVRAVGVPPRWLRLPGDPFDTRLGDVATAPSALAAVSCLAVLAALAALALVAVRRRRGEVAWAAVIGLLLAGAFVGVAASTPAASRKVLGYTLWWGSVAGMWVWLTLAWGSLTLAWAGGGSPRRLRAGIVAAGCTALAALALAVSLSQAGDAHRAEYRPIASIASQLDRSRAPRHGTVLLRSALAGVASPLSQAVKFLLRRRGLRILQKGAVARLGPWYELDRRPYDYVVYAYDGKRSPDPSAVVLARVGMDESHPSFPGGPSRRGVRTITVSLAAHLHAGGGRGKTASAHARPSR